MKIGSVVANANISVSNEGELSVTLHLRPAARRLGRYHIPVFCSTSSLAIKTTGTLSKRSSEVMRCKL